jgi:asparagine synthase (glutamine-hydrolysing)
MCGIAGFWRPTGLGQNAKPELQKMTDAIIRRGPDAAGHWVDEINGVALGHRRLSILDLSSAGAQPMQSENGRYVMTYNGEIYNFVELRQQVEKTGTAPDWRGHSDTEILLAAISLWGLEETLRLANGMFALALWDRQDKVLHLARDRMGEKPLYFGWMGTGGDRMLLFASDLAAIQSHAAFKGTVNTDAVALLARYLHIPEPHCIFTEVQKLMPGTIRHFAIDGSDKTTVYWNTLKEYHEAATLRRFEGSREDAVDELDRLLGAAVARQAVADVPLGTFLSGGIDSSLVTALLQRQHGTPVKSFSIGFSVAAYDESQHARAVAEHLRTDHHELIVTPAQAMAVIPELPSFYSEPLADSSQIPTYLVSRMAREQVIVALSGDAGDEMFGGYNRHVHAVTSWPKLERIPRPLRRVAASVMQGVKPSSWDRLVGPLLAKRAVAVGDKLHKAAASLGAASGDDLYHGLISINPSADALVRTQSSTRGFEGRSLEEISSLPLADRMMALDAVHYLSGDILAKVDRAAMANSLETRVPMLDVDVMRFAWSLPVDTKIVDGKGKWPLRQLLARYVPSHLFDRPKQGFGIPIDHWLRSDLRDWAEDLLHDRRFPLDDYFKRANVDALWQAHLSSARNNQHALWPVLMFQAWRRQQQQ